MQVNEPYNNLDKVSFISFHPANKSKQRTSLPTMPVRASGPISAYIFPLKKIDLINVHFGFINTLRKPSGSLLGSKGRRYLLFKPDFVLEFFCHCVLLCIIN